MKKKRLLIVLAAVLILTVSGSAIALASDTTAADSIKSFFGISTANLTAQQKADLNTFLNQMAAQQKDNAQKMAALQKQAIDKMAQDGAMTKAQADAAKKQIDDQLTKMDQNGYLKGRDMGMGMGKGGRGFHDELNLDLSKLTAAQKADLKTTITKIANTQKDAVVKMVADGAITKDQGDESTKDIDSMVTNFDSNNNISGLLMGKGGFMPCDIEGLDTSKLTDQQKTDLKGYIAQIAGYQKEAVNKLVADGIITKDQGTAETSRIDNMVNNINTNGFPAGRGMGGKGRRGHGDGFHGDMNNSQSNPAL